MSKYRIAQTARFRKDLKTAICRGYNVKLIEAVVNALADGKRLSPRYKDHKLTGAYKGCRECHITPDWLLIYEICQNEVILYLTRTGTHSDPF